MCSPESFEEDQHVVLRAMSWQDFEASYLQCAPDETLARWSDDRIWSGCVW
ncbi:MAG TPA: hypothetical protein VF469_37040 [Kofleriaceae bacterium]